MILSKFAQAGCVQAPPAHIPAVKMQKQFYVVSTSLWPLGKVGSNGVIINTLTRDLQASLMGVFEYKGHSCHLQFSFCKRNGRGEFLFAVGLSKAVRHLRELKCRGLSIEMQTCVWLHTVLKP